jgi:hypothetical protein
MKMTLRILILCISTSTINLYAQHGSVKYPQQNRYSIAVFAGGLGYDAGVGLEIGSPAFSNNRLCIRLKGNINWLEEYKTTYNHWAKYRSAGASVVYNFINVDRSRIFVETGPYIILPDKRFSKRNSYQGLSAAAGIEMFILHTSSVNMCYYFCVGIAYSKATADNLENQPKYGNGFIFSNGFRFYF